MSEAPRLEAARAVFQQQVDQLRALVKDPTLAGEYVLVYKREDAPLLALLERGDTLSLNEITGFRQFHSLREAQMAAVNVPATMPMLEPMQVKDYLQTVLEAKSHILSTLE